MCFVLCVLVPFSRLIRLRDIRRDVDPGGGGGGGGRVVVLSCDVVYVFPVFLVSVSTVVLLFHFLCWSLFSKRMFLFDFVARYLFLVVTKLFSCK